MTPVKMSPSKRTSLSQTTRKRVEIYSSLLALTTFRHSFPFFLAQHQQWGAESGRGCHSSYPRCSFCGLSRALSFTTHGLPKTSWKMLRCLCHLTKLVLSGLAIWSARTLVPNNLQSVFTPSSPLYRCLAVLPIVEAITGLGRRGQTLPRVAWPHRYCGGSCCATTLRVSYCGNGQRCRSVSFMHACN